MYWEKLETFLNVHNASIHRGAQQKPCLLSWRVTAHVFCRIKRKKYVESGHSLGTNNINDFWNQLSGVTQTWQSSWSTTKTWTSAARTKRRNLPDCSAPSRRPATSCSWVTPWRMWTSSLRKRGCSWWSITPTWGSARWRQTEWLRRTKTWRTPLSRSPPDLLSSLPLILRSF